MLTAPISLLDWIAASLGLSCGLVAAVMIVGRLLSPARGRSKLSGGRAHTDR